MVKVNSKDFLPDWRIALKEMEKPTLIFENACGVAFFDNSVLPTYKR